MGADNQAEKIIDRIERMERMQVEIEKLKAQLSAKEFAIQGYIAEIEQLKTRWKP
jgi:hypothetical protein